ncbi:hypothetical protein Fuma_00086 [Fuerstiella marisgermanici]|uniref:Uncharacterized protein n=1 Tax=Fuerstiella marisgermanici TaxID=1891926 RepID=A0A1P8W8X8_9PLAN|nr:hypothetical protein Fuma_00086 [Fuerstiella marisgermanici]
MSVDYAECVNGFNSFCPIASRIGEWRHQWRV